MINIEINNMKKDNTVIKLFVGYILVLLFNFGILIPNTAVAIRRLHDIDKSGWWLLLIFIPLIGLIVLIFWFASKSDEGINRFGDH